MPDDPKKKREEKKNPWWEYTGQPEGAPPADAEDQTPPQAAPEAAPAPEGPPRASQTPPTIKMPGQGGGTEPTLVGQSFTATPAPRSLAQPGGTVPPTQQYVSFSQPGAGNAGSFTPTASPTGGPAPFAGLAGYPAEGLPVMPGTLPAGSPEEIAQYQKLQLSEFGPGGPYHTGSSNLSLLLDVPVPITVVAGRAVMRIQEVLGLQHGSVVPLDRNVEEPVDLLIKDKLIAQGELVVIDEKYFGIKITKIVEPEQRVKDLG